MRKNKRLLIPLLVLLLLTGCGKKEEAAEQGKKESRGTEFTEIEYIPEISFPVFTEDYEKDNEFDKTVMNGTEDPLYFGKIQDKGEGIEKNYYYNKYIFLSNYYQTPYIFQSESDESAPYNYKSYTDMGYGSGSLSFTDRQFELYSPEDYDYELSTPGTRIETSGARQSVAKDITVEEYASVLDSLGFIHIKDISITSDVMDGTEDDLYKKYVKARFNTFDNTTLYGFVCTAEYMDKQYFYLVAKKEEMKDSDIEEMVDEIETNDTDIYEVFKETEARTESKSVSFDVSGVAGTLDIPGYFRTSEISNNIYSSALTYIPEKNRFDNTISQLPNSYGASEVFLKNEYLNTVITFNSLMKNENMATEFDFLLYYFGNNSSQSLMLKENNYYVQQRGEITDKDGNKWNSYIIKEFFDTENYPQTIPYGKYVLVYARENGDFENLFTVSCGLDDWYTSEALLQSFDNIISTFTETASNTEKPAGPLTFYYSSMDANEEATATDAEEVIEETTEEETEETTEEGEEKDKEKKGDTEASDEDILKDLGLTPDDVDNAPDVSDMD